MTPKIVILGCGWLGQQIAPILAQAGYVLYGSRRSADAAATLAEPLKGVVIDLADDAPADAATLALLQNAWVICAVPPGRTADNQYLPSLQRLAALTTQAEIRGGIHISSTGIYQGLTGVVHEQSPLVLTDARVARLAAGEACLQQQDKWLTLRLAGLMGQGRHPARYTQGKMLAGAAVPVNMVHATDVAHAVLALLQSWPLPQHCYNLSSPQLVLKQDFYQAAAISAGLTAVTFDSDTAIPWRQVQATAIARDTLFCYQYPDARNALADCH